MVFNGIPGYDLDFADDIFLLSHNQKQMQDKTTPLATNSTKTGLKIGKKNTKILRTNTTCNSPILLEEESIAEVESFKYLGSIIDKQGGTDKEVLTRIGKARAIFHMPKSIWKSRELATITKLWFSIPT